jgi:DNA-binding MarR family transcriptional regulator
MMNVTGPDLCYALAARKKARYLTRLYDARLAPVELSISQFSILSLLQEHGRLKLVELAEMLVMERTSLVRALKPLQLAHYVVAESADSGRAQQMLLSAEGRDKVAQATPLWLAAQAEFEAEVGVARAIDQRDAVLALPLAPR